jgi:type IV secretion system protein VirB6
MKPFSDLMDLILSPLKSAAVQGAENLASGIGTTVQLGLTLYIILFGWQIARGEIAEPWNEFAKRAVKLGIIVALIQSTGIYRAYVIDFLAGDLPEALSNALSSKPIPDASAFDSLANQIAILLTQLWQGTGWSAPAETARASVVTLLAMPFLWCALIVGFTVTLWAKAGMYFVAALGPLFIALAMFEQTGKYLHNWLDQIVTPNPE